MSAKSPYNRHRRKKHAIVTSSKYLTWPVGILEKPQNGTTERVSLSLSRLPVLFMKSGNPTNKKRKK